MSYKLLKNGLDFYGPPSISVNSLDLCLPVVVVLCHKTETANSEHSARTTTHVFMPCPPETCHLNTQLNEE